MEMSFRNMNPGIIGKEYNVVLNSALNALESVKMYKRVSYVKEGIHLLDESYLSDLNHLLDYGVPIPNDVWTRISSLYHTFPIAIVLRENNFQIPPSINSGNAIKQFFDCECNNDWLWNKEKIDGFPPFMRKIIYDRFEFMFYYIINVRDELEFDIRNKWLPTCPEMSP
jgi:hypothetical protein